MKNIKITAIICSLVLLTSIFVLPLVFADSESVTLGFLIGTGFLCDLDSSACPVIAMADNGDTVELTGTGTLSTHPKSVSGEGTFVHKNADGTILATGTWTATKLLSFHSYGSGATQGLPEELEGGRASILVHLNPDTGGPGFDAILEIDCTLGNKIPNGAIEGIRLNVKDALNFNKMVSGFTVFINE
ncbi:hypothetical protein HYV49_05905 [Candidatus Pacearchaeota archaeon]|nr:hypothetical protein [Candidatus Pacearchaeota archaeon]